MESCDYASPWYHGSPDQLTILRAGSWVTQFKELAKAFSHRPSLISFADDNQSVKHNGQQLGFLYVLAEPVGPEDVTYLLRTAQTHWQIQHDIRVVLVAKLPVDAPPQLSEEEITAMRREMPEGTTGLKSDRNE